jgi:hypothetical protein
LTYSFVWQTLSVVDETKLEDEQALIKIQHDWREARMKGGRLASNSSL